LTPDNINACFEIGGFFAICLSIVKTLKDKQVKGISLWYLLFFSSWGGWNLYYYPHLKQSASFLVGILVMIANLVWLALLIYFSHFKEPVDESKS